MLELTGDRVVLVGEMNPYGADPEMALVHYPTGCSGYHLWRILGLPEDRYLALARQNLCVGAWSAPAATAAAHRLFSELPDPTPGPQTLVVLLGARVAGAFRGVTLRGGAPAPLAEWQDGADACGRARWVRLPHPSGLNRSWGAGMWSPGGTVERARRLLRLLAPRVPWGDCHPIRGLAEGPAA